VPLDPIHAAHTRELVYAVCGVLRFGEFGHSKITVR
jgi:hypothetical protein